MQKRSNLIKFFSLLSICFCKICFAQIPHIYALHINGITTTYNNAYKNMLALHESSKIETNLITWNVVYNPTQGNDELLAIAFFKGIWDTFWQKFDVDKVNPTLDEFTQIAIKQENLNYAPGTSDYITYQNNIVKIYQENLIDFGGKNLQTVINNFHNAVPIQYAGVLNLLSESGSFNYTHSSDYVILLPHSQGNAYANNLYTYLTQTENFNKDHITIFGFATPNRDEYGDITFDSNNNYVTSDNDIVIKAAHVFGPIMPSNISIPPSSKDVMGHSLVDIYLAESACVTMYNDYVYRAGITFFRDIKQAARYEMYYSDNLYAKVGNNIICNKSIWGCNGKSAFFPAHHF